MTGYDLERIATIRGYGTAAAECSFYGDHSMASEHRRSANAIANTAGKELRSKLKAEFSDAFRIKARQMKGIR